MSPTSDGNGSISVRISLIPSWPNLHLMTCILMFEFFFCMASPVLDWVSIVTWLLYIHS